MTRGANPTAYQKVMFDNFEIIANLHLHRFNAAADGIDRILAAAAEGTCPHVLDTLNPGMFLGEAR